MAKKKAAKKKTATKKAPKKKASKKKAAKKSMSTSASKRGVLTADQQKKVRKLLKSKDAKNIELAIGLLQSTGATTDDWTQSFSSTVISQLVNTWDCDVWNTVAAGLQPFRALLKEFVRLAEKRFGKLSEPKKQDLFIIPFLSNREPHLSLVIGAILSKHKGDLNLGSLTKLSDAAAESLGKHEGDLDLDGLTSLSEAAAESFSSHTGQLFLDGLTELSDAAAESLRKNGGWLTVNGLTSLSDVAAESLSKSQHELNLNGLTSLSDAAAESLGKHKGGELYLSGLTSLSDAAAESLSKHKGGLNLGAGTRQSIDRALLRDWKGNRPD